jgi:hypothetical protein
VFTDTGHLSHREVDDATIAIVRAVQCESFHDVIKKLPDHDDFETPFRLNTVKQLRQSPEMNGLQKLSPFVVKGVLYVGGRLQKSALSLESKHQMILPARHWITDLIVSQYHERQGHSGTLHVLSAVRERFWILRGQSTVRRILKDCRKCRFWNAKVGQQMMAPLPESRVTPGNPPFTSVGVDYMGPIMTKLGRSQVKRYACIFTCMATRAIHIEVAQSLDTSSFIDAFLRFTSRRGGLKKMFSDNGTNFVGAERELREGVKKWNQKHINDQLIKIGIDWKFNPPAASHQGGVWERMIRSVRKVMRAIAGERPLDDFALMSLLTEVERILNDRPMTPTSDDPNDLSVLTPSSLLHGTTDCSLPPDEFMKADGYRKSWRRTQLLADEFWRRWVKEYLPILQLRQKWFRPVKNFKVGDIVLIVDETSPRGSWRKAIVKQCFADSTGLIRRVRVKTATNELTRDIRKLCLLEAHP